MRAPQKHQKKQPDPPTPPPKGPAPSTEGQRLLRAVDASLSEVAKRVGVSKALVGFWRGGSKLPAPEMRRVIASLYGIPAASWDTKVGAAAKPAGEAGVARIAVKGTNREGAEAMLEAILKERSSRLTVQEFTRLVDAEARVRKLIHDLDQSEQLTETRIVTSPVMIRIRNAAFASLAPYPDALRAFLAAIGQPVTA